MKNKSKLKRLIYWQFGFMVPAVFASTLSGVITHHKNSINEYKLINHAGEELDPSTPTQPNDPNAPVMNNNNNGADANKPEQPPRMPANLEMLKADIDAKMSDAIKDFIDAVFLGKDNLVDQKIESVKNQSDLSFEDKFNRTLYYSQLKAFFQKNKDQIISNPSKFGLDIVYPYVISANKEFNKGTIVFNGKTYENKIWGNTPTTNYEKEITGDGNSITPNPDAAKAKVENTTSDEEGKNVLKTYFDALRQGATSIFLNDEDLPKVGEDYEINGRVTSTNDAGVFSNKPNKFDTWDDYIISKIKPRFIDFDLEQNKDPAEQNQMNQQSSQSVENLLPPTVPVEGEAVPTDPKELIENIPRFVPQVRSLYSTLSTSALLNRYSTYTEPNKSDVFFYFENPINTRFSYTVTSLSLNNGKIEATVMIQDAVDKDARTTYTRELDTVSLSGTAQQINENRELAYPAIERLFLNFYQAVGLNADLNYADATKVYVEPQTIFQMVYLAMRAINKPEFKNDLNTILSRGIGFSTDQSDSYFLNFLRNQLINSQFLYWQLVSEMYKRIFVAFIRDFNKEDLKPKLLAILQQNGVTINQFNDSFTEARRKLLRLDSLTKQTIGSPQLQFDSLVTQIKEMNQTLRPFNLVYDAISDQAKGDAQKQAELEASLKSFSTDINGILANSKAVANPFLIVLAVFLGLISMSLYGFYFMQLAFNKTKQINKLNKPLIITVLIIASIALVSTALIAFKIIGVF
ncbi:hypothetical protein H3143_03245 [Mycoplasma tullyi]|uniref:Transmembrane protein n=1 Tax=Mycoplasma tullyi TaxID=1612150 RepID=A0A7D7U335_9MOLU|nr:hypothetical protein [Mycoplasma tullyi]QMT98489.1 hypothetical protein H3143_03245 [Mycoplasma tullyi]